MTGADNQQERLDSYIAGYVDGEGSFSVSVQRNASCRVGFQLVPEFHVNPLLSSKQADFEKFAGIVRALALGHHRTTAGFRRLLEVALSMNGGGRFRKVRWNELVAVQNPQRLHARQGP